MSEDLVNPIKNLFNSLDMLTTQNMDHRDDAFNDVVDGTIIDTVCPPDTKRWETGISKRSGNWAIVEQYPNRDAASEGHSVWVEAIRKDPDTKLIDIFYKDVDDSYTDYDDDRWDDS